MIGAIIGGIVAGWAAGKLINGKGFGCIWDLIIGLIGGVIGKRTALIEIIKSRVNEDIISAAGGDGFIKRAGAQIIKNHFLFIHGKCAE